MENKLLKKQVKRDARPIGTSLLLYLLITIVSITPFTIIGCLLGFDHCISANLDAFIGSLLGLGFMFLFFRKKATISKSFAPKKKMRLSILCIMVCMIIGSSLLVEIGSDMFSDVLGIFGLEQNYDKLDVALNDNNIFNLLSIWILAPIGEELIFRGFLMQHLKKYGKAVAICVTAVLFGLLHGNFYQALNAFFAGLLLGYVATEYSITWSIVLHFINNFVLCYALPYALNLLGTDLAIACSDALTIICFIISVIFMLKKSGRIEAWLKANPFDGKKAKWILCSATVLIYILITLACFCLFICVA